MPIHQEVVYLIKALLRAQPLKLLPVTQHQLSHDNLACDKLKFV